MRFLIFISLSIFLLPHFAFAQALDGLGGTDTFTVSINPQYLTPHGSAVLSFVSSTLDLQNATLVVSKEGKQIYQGTVQPTAVSLGDVGRITVVSIKITSNGTTYPKTILLQPQDSTLIAEPLSSAPVLYQGKSNIPLGGNTRIVAFANFADSKGKSVNPAALSYTWTVDNTTISNSSGIGKSTIIVTSPLQYRERTVSVSIKDQTGGLVGGSSLTLAPKDPSLRLYENDPLLGIRFEHALSGSFTINGSESSLFAAPFSLPQLQNKPLFTWFLNGKRAQDGNTITLRPAGTGQGSASLSFVAEDGASSRTTTNLSLIFGEKKSTNFFGL